MPSGSTVLVTGATGYVGGRLVPCLLREGYRVRCFVRDAEALRSRAWYDEVEIAVGDALDAETIPPAMEGVDAVYYLIHSLGAGEEAFVERDRRVATNVRTATEAEGVDRIVYLGGMRPKGERHSKHLRSRMETGNVLRDGSVPVTEFRAAQIVGSGSLSFELVRYLTERVPVLICPRWVQTPTQPIAIRDVLNYLVAALDQPASAGEIIEIGGANVLTYADMFRTYAAVRGLWRPVVNLPFLTPRLSSHWVGFVTPLSPTVARPLIEGLDNEVTVDDPETARRLFPDIEPISYEASVRLALRRGRRESHNVAVPRESLSDAEAQEQRVSHEMSQGVYRETRTTAVDAPADVAFDTITQLGGQKGWLYGNLLWRLRGWMDRVVGGVGLRRGRRSDVDLREGDALDFWRVEALEENRLLRLRAEMKLPGHGWLEFRVVPVDDTEETIRLIQTATFEPKGLTGTLYWYAVLPLHDLVFGGLLTSLKDWIEERAAGRASDSATDLPPKDGTD